MNARLLGITGTLVGAALIVTALFANQWLRADIFGTHIRVGLRAVTVCDDGACETGSLATCREFADRAAQERETYAFFTVVSESPSYCQALLDGAALAEIDRAAQRTRRGFQMRDRPPHIDMASYLVFAKITFILSLVALPLLLLCVGLAAANKHVLRPVSPSTLALFVLIGLLITSPVTVAVNPFLGLGVTWGFLVHGIGVTLALLGCTALGRLRPPESDDWESQLPPMREEDF